MEWVAWQVRGQPGWDVVHAAARAREAGLQRCALQTPLPAALALLAEIDGLRLTKPDQEHQAHGHRPQALACFWPPSWTADSAGP